MTHQLAHHDSLAPAPVAETLRYLGGLRNSLSRRWWVGIIALHCVLLACTILEANVLGYSVDVLRGVAVPIVGMGERALMILVGVACAATFVGHCLRSLANYLIGIKLRRMSVDLKRDCLNSTLQAPIPDVMALGTGNVITRMTHDIDQPVTQFSQIGSGVMFMLLMFPFSIGAMTLIDYRFGVLALVIAVIFVPISKRWIGALPPVTNAVSAIEAERNATLLDTLRGLATFKAFRYGAWALDRMQTKSWAALQATATRVPYINRLLHLAQTISGVWVIAALGLGAWLTAHNHITAGAASAAVFLAVRAETQIFNTMLFLNDIQEGMTRLGRAVALAKLYTPTSQHTAPDLEKPADVTIRGLEFSYPDTTEPVLPTLDLTLAAGTTTALVGASGAGKSTLAALMSGLLRPTAGTITVGDVDIAQVSDVWTARNVTLISQEVHIFSGLLRDDLRMAAPTATDGELLDALAAVGLPENGTAFRRAFPLGLDTQVGAGAVPLMPEVQQQIALARVLLRNPHVLILDEATSEAGSDQAHTLEAAAQLVTQGRTALVVAHRLDQAVVADRIIVMDAGRIIEGGRHADLVAAGGRYAQLFARWSGQDHTM